MISTGSHGSSLAHGTMSDLVAGLTLVSWDGSVVKLGCLAEAEKQQLGAGGGEEGCGEGGGGRLGGGGAGELLRAARMAGGRVGIIVEVALQTEEARLVRKHERLLSVDEFALAGVE